MITLGVNGLVGLAQSLTRGARVRADAQAALEAVAEEVADDIRSAAPDRTGRLQASVRVEPGEEAPSVVILAGGPETTKPSRGGPYDYAVGTEFGTSREDAQPFFYNTIRAAEPEIRKRVQSAVLGAIKD